MSTAEKLEAISELGFKAMRPEIVAVVEAAEEVAAVPRTVWDQYTNNLYTNAASRLQDALDELDKELP